MNKLKSFAPSLMTEGTEILRELHDYAKANGFEVFLGGGAVRDQVNGLPVRDLDIGVINCPEGHHNGLVEIVMNANWEITKVYGREGSSDYCESFEGEEDRYDSIVQFESLTGDKPLDLLFYTDSFSTIASVMASHDHSINQYACWYGSLGLNVAYLGDQKAYGICRQLRRGVTPERIEKMQKTAGLLGWTYAGLPPLPEPDAPAPAPDEFDDLLN